MQKKYTVKNIYGIAGESTHRTPEAALRARDRREGDGWVVEDDDGYQWGWRPADDGSGKIAVRGN